VLQSGKSRCQGGHLIQRERSGSWPGERAARVSAFIRWRHAPSLNCHAPLGTLLSSSVFRAMPGSAAASFLFHRG
jgi:hypothetical protein